MFNFSNCVLEMKEFLCKGMQQHAHAYIINFPGTINYKQSRKVQSDTKYALRFILPNPG